MSLGHDVYYFEDTGEWPYTLDGGLSGNDWIAYDPTANVTHLAGVMERFGLRDRWAYRFPIEDRWYGLSDTRRADVLRTADLLINVSGTLEHPHHYREIPRLAYIDSDPVFTQIKLVLAEHAAFRERVDVHDVHFSFGECLGPGLLTTGGTANVPDTGHLWHPTRQPILLDEWRPAASYRNAYTTVMSWTSYKPLQYNGSAYGQKNVEFQPFLDLPSQVHPVPLEIAVGGLQHAEWEATALQSPDVGAGESRPSSAAALLRSRGWSVVDPLRECNDLDSYRAYIEASKGEWSIAKNGYVLGQPGWFSCRSACYLAAGRPTIVQDTGFSQALPTGAGIVAFSSPKEAAAAVAEVEGNYPHHARQALAIAHEYFDFRTVLDRLVADSFRFAAVSSASA